ncbi:MAG: CHAT domain-containing protein [Acidobacteriota bacterium]|nr:CHAT domain-containing protein [Acidobacteriota bacterium]
MKDGPQTGSPRPTVGRPGLLAAGCLGLTALLLGCGDGEPLQLPTVLRGHEEVRLLDDGQAMPVALNAEQPLGLCLEVDPATDTSRWEARLDFGRRPSPDGFQPATARMGRTLCFDALPPPEAAASGRVELCGELVDRFDDRRFRLPCRSLLFSGDGPQHRRLVEELDEVLAASYRTDVFRLAEQLDGLSKRAQEAGWPLLEVRLDLILVHFLTLDGSPRALDEARRRLDALPPWLATPETSARGAQAAYQRALFALDAEQRLGDAWTFLLQAEQRYRRIADPNRFLVTVQQAAILTQVGSRGEAVQRLSMAISDCATMPCDEDLLAHARGELAWLILLDPYALERELQKAETNLLAGLDVLDESRYPLEVANQWINLAYLRVRQGHSPAAELQRAEGLLGQQHPDGEQHDDGDLDGEDLRGEGVGRLLDWAGLVRGVAALDNGVLERAVALCGELAGGNDPQLSAWALSCLGRAHRRAGDLERAAWAFDQALLRHEFGQPEDIDQQLSLAPGQRADDFARAARLEVERGSPEAAWELLARLDLLSADESERRRCREQAEDPEILRRWDEIETESRLLMQQLVELATPAAGQRREQAESIRRQLQERLSQLWRQWPGCRRAPDRQENGLDFRAVALEDEILLLHRLHDGSVKVEKRTDLPREHLVQITGRIEQALSRRDLDDGAWRQLVTPLARALLPRGAADRESSGEPLTFALHGLLQTVPLGALPVLDAGTSADDGGTEDGPRWFASTTTVVLRPAGTRPSSPARPAQDDRPLPEGAPRPVFVVDPRGDLAGAGGLLATYRQLFPEARVLAGREATAEAFRAALPAAAWLHVDAHGLYDSAFPELSAIQLADRPLPLVELAELPTGFRFANLSGCQTGRWPTTADSGRYGVAGLLSRLGVTWVIGSRWDLEDAVAEGFNRSFYQRLAAGDAIPLAHRRALASVQSRFPAVSWAGLLLLGDANSSGANRPSS